MARYETVMIADTCIHMANFHASFVIKSLFIFVIKSMHILL